MFTLSMGSRLSACLYIAKGQLQVSLAYRFQVFASLLSQLIILVASVFFWKSAYGTQGPLGGLGVDQMVTYAILGCLLAALFSFETEGRVTGRIRDGDIALDFLKPIPAFALYLSQDLGKIAGAVVQSALPILVVSMVFFAPLPPASSLHLVLFLASLPLSFLLMWLLSALVGLAAFWVIELGPLGFVKDVLVRVLSGSIVPLWFFPQPWQGLLQWLPFPYIYQLPLGIYIGKDTPALALAGLGIQAGWALVLAGLFWWLHRKAEARVMVQGG